MEALMESTMLKAAGALLENNIQAADHRRKMFPCTQFQVMIADLQAPIKGKGLLESAQQTGTDRTLQTTNSM